MTALALMAAVFAAENPALLHHAGYLLSFGAQVEIIEPKYLKGVLAARAQELYSKNS